MLAVGDHVQRFQITGMLGAGAMGTVFRAFDPQLQREVAIKLVAKRGPVVALSENETMDLRTDVPAQTDDLLGEARMMARLSHPNVLPVYEVGLVEDSVFLVMEHIDGSTLTTWLAEPRSTPETLATFVQAARGLAAAHACGIVHRDFKPDNVLIGRDGRVRVADFGLSRLTERPRNSMRRIGEEGGTPRFMAPELWHGGQPSARSDAFAFCVALAGAFGAEPGPDLERALRERDVPPRLRAAIAEGLAEDPAARPEVEALIAAIEDRHERPRRRWWIAAGVVAIAAVGGAAVLTGSHAPAACTLESLAGRWDGPRRDALRSALGPKASAPADRERLDLITTTFDEIQRQSDERWLSTCNELRDGKLTATQAQVRRSCLERREIELGARIDRFIEIRPDLRLIVDRARIAEVPDCDEVNAPPLPADRAPVAALYKQFVVSEELPTAEHAKVLLAITHDAAAVGERELEMRTMLNAGIQQSEAGDLTGSDESLRRAYQMTLDIHATRMTAIVLNFRARTASKRGDSTEALDLGKLALEIAQRPNVPPSTRARIYMELAGAAVERGDGAQGLEHVQKGLALVAQDRHRLPYVESALRIYYVRALGGFPARKLEALQVARDNVDWTRVTFGEHSQPYGSALSSLASQQRWNGDRKSALATQKQAVEVTTAALPAGDPAIELTMGDYALMLDAAGEFEQSRAIYAREVADAAHNDVVKAFLPLTTYKLGQTMCELGRYAEGLPLIEKGVELAIEKYGAGSDWAVEYRIGLGGVQIELRRYREAERTIGEVEAILLKDAKHWERTLVMVRGVMRASLLEGTGKLRAAEKLTREGLVAWDELEGDAQSRVGLLALLGDELVEQARWDEARRVLEQARALAVAQDMRVDTMASIDVALARAEAALGHMTEGRKRARDARAVLDAFPGAIHARADADKLLHR